MPLTKKSLKVSREKFKRNDASTPKFIEGCGNIRPLNTVCHFPKNAGDKRSFDFIAHYGKGFDDIVNRVYYTTQNILERSTKCDVTQSSVVAYLYNGFSPFSAFLAQWSISSSRELIITDINPDVIKDFILYLRGLEIKYTSQKNYYTRVKALLKAIATHGYWMDVSQQEINEIFPSNPYPNSNRRYKGEQSFNQYEKTKLVVALKKEIKPIYEKITPLTAYELTICVLSIALQTGINTTPLLKLTTSSMSDHPLKKERKLLTVYKARGNSTQLHSLRESKQVKFSRGVKLDVAGLIDKIITLNSGLRVEGGTDRLLVYRTEKRSNTAGSLSTLSEARLNYYIKKLVRNNNLKDKAGKPIRANISRIRKTFLNRIYELSGQDILIAAKCGKHDTRTSEDYYLQAPEEVKLNMGVMAEIRVKELTSNDIEYTPVASCKDVIMGDKAPKDGKTPCCNYLECFHCRSFVITGGDLHRLFSFYWAMIRSRGNWGSKKWNKYLRNIVRVIDENVSPQFPLPVIEAAKEKAKISPHPYWINLDMLRIGQ